jgi:hypothetical protein
MLTLLPKRAPARGGDCALLCFRLEQRAPLRLGHLLIKPATDKIGAVLDLSRLHRLFAPVYKPSVGPS